jgi:ribosomal protein L10
MMQVKNIEMMRRKLPESVDMVVTKNRLLRVAVDQLEDEAERAKWEGLKGQKGQNAYVFAPEDSMRGAVKAYNDLFSTLKVRLRALACSEHDSLGFAVCCYTLRPGSANQVLRVTAARSRQC